MFHIKQYTLGWSTGKVKHLKDFKQHLTLTSFHFWSSDTFSYVDDLRPLKKSVPALIPKFHGFVDMSTVLPFEMQLLLPVPGSLFLDVKICVVIICNTCRYLNYSVNSYFSSTPQFLETVWNACLVCGSTNEGWERGIDCPINQSHRTQLRSPKQQDCFFLQ